MITEFSIKNFLSFKNTVTFSMLATSSSGLDDNYIRIEDKKILKSSAIYGANASGKSNIFKVLSIVVSMLKDSNNININDKLPIVPFKLSKETDNSPSEFEIKFIIEKIKYVYGFSADENKIYEEYLYYYPNGRETKIFDRSDTDKYSFPQKDEKILRDIEIKNASNKFFLATATTWNYEKTKLPYMFLTKTINIFSNINELRMSSAREYIKNENNLRDFALEFLSKADFNIIDYRVIETTLPKEILEGLPDALKKDIKSIPMVTNVLIKHKNSNTYLTLKEESMGTQIMFFFIPFINDALHNQRVIVVDELDRSLHPYLVELIVQIFNDSTINKNGAQLIFNTHDTNLLNLNLLRRDQIWFTEKDNDTGISNLYCLNDFSVRKQENIEKGYILGRYGAVPLIKNDLNL